MNTTFILYIFIGILFQEMDSDSFDVRVKATSEMKKLLPLSLPYLEKGLTSKSTELSIRCKILVIDYYKKTAQKRAMAIKYHPRIDYLPYWHKNRSQIIYDYIVMAQQFTGKKLGSPNYENHHLATYFYIRDMYSSYKDSKLVESTLREMLITEKAKRNNSVSFDYRKYLEPKKPEQLPLPKNAK